MWVILACIVIYEAKRYWDERAQDWKKPTKKKNREAKEEIEQTRLAMIAELAEEEEDVLPGQIATRKG